MFPDNDQSDRLKRGATAAEAIDWVADRLQRADLYYGHGTDNPHDEAAAIVFFVAGARYPVAADAYDRVLGDSQRDALVDLLGARIESRKPLAYLTHEAWFAGLPFYVDERVLVPRSPIAELIAERFEPWIRAEAVTRILDLCTGSGCIGIACAQAFPAARVDASDISEEALAVAAENVQRFDLGDRVRLVRSDLFAQLEPARYDLIVSNPPYVSAEEMERLPDEYRREPALGLAAGNDGLRMVRPILENARAYLADHGLLVVEVGASQAALEAAYPLVPFTWVEFAHGGEGVFLMTAAELDEFGAELGRN